MAMMVVIKFSHKELTWVRFPPSLRRQGWTVSSISEDVPQPLSISGVVLRLGLRRPGKTFVSSYGIGFDPLPLRHAGLPS